MRRQLFLMGWRARGLTHLSPVSIHCGAPHSGHLVAFEYTDATVKNRIVTKIGQRGYLRPPRKTGKYAQPVCSVSATTWKCKLS